MFREPVLVSTRTIFQNVCEASPSGLAAIGSVGGMSIADRVLIPETGNSHSCPAQSNVCTTTATVASAAEATALGSSCQTVEGDIIVASGAVGTIDLGAIRQITGDLKVEDNDRMVTFSGASLSSIGGDFTLDNVTVLSSLSFPQLSSVGSITWTSLPALGGLTFAGYYQG